MSRAIATTTSGQLLPRPVPHGWCYLPSLSASDLRGRLVAIENVAQHFPLTVHARPRLHELPCVLDALPLGTVQTELVGAGGDGQVSRARYDDLGRLKGEGKVRRFQYPGPRRPHSGPPAHARSARRQELPVLGVDVADCRRVLRRHGLNPFPFQLADGPLFSGDVGVAGATAHACGGGEGEDQAHRAHGNLGGEEKAQSFRRRALVAAAGPPLRSGTGSPSAVARSI